MSMKLEDIHYVAERFLQDPWAKEPHTMIVREEDVEHLQVILARDVAPRFFCGTKLNGMQPVWAHEARFAKPLPRAHAETWQEVLEAKGHTTVAMWEGVRG
jgi:hypothetical protein